jgi:hypothetical protein
LRSTLRKKVFDLAGARVILSVTLGPAVAHKTGMGRA